MEEAKFQHAATSSLRNNRALRRGSGSYFHNRNAKAHRYVARKNKVNSSDVAKTKQQSISKRGIAKVLGVVSIVLIIFYGIIQLAFFISNLEYRTYIGSKVGKELNEKSLTLKQYDYHAWVRTGDEYLYFQQLDKAQNAYVHALDVFSNGKKANEGLSQVLSAKCERNNLYCKEARLYEKN